MKRVRLARRTGAGPAYQRTYQRSVQRTQAARTLQFAIRRRNLGARQIPANIPLGTLIRQPRYPNMEVKTLDVGLGVGGSVTSNLTNNALFTICNPIQVGTGTYQRIGEKVQLKALRLNLNFNYVYMRNTVGSHLNGNRLIVRLMLWKQSGSATAFPNWNGIFGNTAQDGTTSVSLHSHLFANRTNEYVVLREWDNDFSPQSGDLPVANQTAICPFSIDDYVKFGGIEARYVGTANPMTVANCSSNLVFLCMRASVDDVNSTQIFFTPQCVMRLTYYD